MTTAEIIGSTADLFAFRSEWEELWRRVPGASPFQSPSWLLPWWRQFGTDSPVVATWRMGNRLAGVLPCYVLAERGDSKLLPIGVSLSDYFDALIAVDAPLGTATQLLSAVLEAAGVSVCDLPDMPPGAALLDAEPSPDWQAHAIAGQPCPVLSVPDGATFDRIVPAKTRRKLRMNRNRADRIGGWTTRWADPSTFPAALGALIDLHQARWTAKDEPGVFSDRRVPECLGETGADLLSEGGLALASVVVRDQTAAACLMLRSVPDRLYLYLSGFAEEFAFLSPGTILLGDIVETAIRDGVREIHFLRGSEAYKYAWGGVDRRNTTREFRRR